MQQICILPAAKAPLAKFDRTTKEQYNNVTYEYAYDAMGHLAKQTSTGGEEYNYEYDSLGRLIRSNEYNGGSLEQRTEHIYDASDRLTKQTWIKRDGESETIYPSLQEQGTYHRGQL